MQDTRSALLLEIQSLESSLSVLIPVARGLDLADSEGEFYRAELPVAIEDARQALSRLRHLVMQLDKPGKGTARDEDGRSGSASVKGG